MPEPLVYVLVINWNGREHLEECFASLLGGTYGRARFLLLDNASEDGSAEFVQGRFGADPRVEIVACGANLGWSRGNNVGLEKALDEGADYVFLLNNDTVTAPDAIAKLVEAAERRPELGALAPKMLLYDHPDLLNSLGLGCSIIGSCWDFGLGRLDGPRWDEPRPVIGACGGACFLRVEALRTAGLLPTDFDIYLDDLDLCLRLWNAGYEIWTCPAAVVRHKFSATMGMGTQCRRKYYLNTRNRLRMMLLNYPASKWLWLKPVVFAGECRAIGRAVLDGEFWKVGVHLRAWGAAWTYVPRALAERLRRRRLGLHRCRFWHLVDRRRMFFPGVELPERGWYTPWIISGRTVRPMSARAELDVVPGPLRIAAAHPYPELDAIEVEVTLDGRPVAVLRTLDAAEATIEIASPGTLVFTARKIFYAEDTGEAVDFGGWINVEKAG